MRAPAATADTTGAAEMIRQPRLGGSIEGPATRMRPPARRTLPDPGYDAGERAPQVLSFAGGAGDAVPLCGHGGKACFAPSLRHNIRTGTGRETT